MKRKIAELEPIVAKKRREQTRRAQRGYRQRQEDARVSLQSQVDRLQLTIEGLNACFLSLTDSLTSSQSLKKDKFAVNELRKAMQTFLDLNRSCDSLADGGERSDSEITSQQYSKITDFAPPNSMNQTQSESNRPSPKTYSILPAPPRRLPIPQSRSHTASLPSPLLNFSPAHVLSFAARLQQTAYQTGLYLASNIETSTSFRRVFSYALNFRTHPSLFHFLSKVVNENFERLLEPPEANSPPAGPQSQPNGWLNATEVSCYFSQRGFNFDNSSLYVQIEIDAGYPSTNTMGDLPAFLPWLQPASNQDETMIKSRTANLHSGSACVKRRVVVDVGKLINNIVVPGHTQCFGRNPMYNQENLDNALRQAVVKDSETWFS